jgi:Uma2 family endonuclease
MSAIARLRMTVAEYLAWDFAHEEKHEFVNGEIWAMAGAHTVHNLLTMNLGASLHRRLRDTPCRPLSADMRVLIDETGLYCYPDLTVVCGRPETIPTRPPTLLNPRLIVEVLSESTAAFDKDVKFAHYRRRASVQSIVFVSWPERRIEHDGRDGDGWRLTEARGSEVLPVASLDVEIPLDEVYDGMAEYLEAESSPDA